VTDRELTFEASYYSADAIQRAIYKFSDRLSCDLISDEQEFRCILHLTATTEDEIEAALSDFRNEALDQTLRERIRVETQEVRNLVLALAFSNTGLVDQSESDAESQPELDAEP
jgi:His-Xaa-Ser system protein HxsD